MALIFTVGAVGTAYAKAPAPLKGVKSRVARPIAVKVATPSLQGKTKAAAQLVLKKAGLKLGQTRLSTTGKAKPGTVVKQQPRAKTMLAKGSAVDIWLLRKASKAVGHQKETVPSLPKPKIYPLNKNLYMEFPRNVRDIVILDDRGNRLQQFKSGRRFDITQSLIKTKAGLIYVAQKPRSGGVQKRRGPSSPPDRMAIPLHDFRHLAHRRIVIDDNRTIERNEPANDRIEGAPLLSAGYFSGDVSDGDVDFLKTTAAASGVGTLIEVEVKSGHAELHYYYPNRSRIDGYTNKFWIALAPGTTFYFEVRPTRTTSGDYRIAISKKPLNDAYETNDTFAQAKVLSSGRAFLGNVINSSSNHVGVIDFYQFNVPEPQNLRIQVTNAGLAPGDQVEIALHNRHNTHVTSHTGNANGCTLNHDLRPAWPRPDEHPVFPAGQWRIEVRTPTAGAGYPEAYGNGDPPDCYTEPAGYTLTVSVLP